MAQFRRQHAIASRVVRVRLLWGEGLAEWHNSGRRTAASLLASPPLDKHFVPAAGWYVRLLRDEVLAEWCLAADGSSPELHVYCHVSGQERWLAPPQLRNYIFKREMPLVCDLSCTDVACSYFGLKIQVPWPGCMSHLAPMVPAIELLARFCPWRMQRAVAIVSKHEQSNRVHTPI